MQKPIEQKIGRLQDIASRDGVRGAVKAIHEFLTKFLRIDNEFKNRVFFELTPLYGEFDYTPAGILTTAEATITVIVPGATLGYTAEASYDKDIQGLQMTAWVSAADTVKIKLRNNSGSTVTLTAGRFRAYVKARELTT